MLFLLCLLFKNQIKESSEYMTTYGPMEIIKMPYECLYKFLKLYSIFRH